jgi:transglutaminase-like putative cysteine protease
MTTTQARPHTPPELPAPSGPVWRASVLAPAAAGLATVSASTALVSVVGGLAWFGYVLVATILIVCTGLALRSLRTPTLLVGLAQLVVLTVLVTGVFTRHAIAAVVPGPAALSELNDLLIAAFDQIRTSVPPTEATPPILCLVTIAIGLVAIVVDTLAVAAAAPAATGLVLLCVYAVPSALSDDMLPWWTFGLGAASFAGLLAVDGSHRHRRWRTRSAPGLGPSPSSASTPVAVVAVALVVGLVAGSALTAIGTVGRLPGSSQGGQNGSVTGGLGINPFTSVRGMLEQGPNVELFRVRGLGNDKRLMRAFTLNTYRPNEGWGLPAGGTMPAGVPAAGPLPPAPGDDGSAQSRTIRIQPVNWVDVWLPVYGAPRELRGIDAGWYYDQASGAVFRERRDRPAPYVEVASLAEPGKEELRAAEPAGDEVDPIYTSDVEVDPRVAALTRQLTEDDANTFDKTSAIWRYLSTEGGFVYDTRTAESADEDALADFLLNGKRGFCEQFASAMAVMLRDIGIPARVAVGFTTGYPTADYRSITSQDAHAWVEVYFGEDLGWVSFDPTPLSDGRGYVPPYLQPDEVPSSGPTEQNSADPSPSAAAQVPDDEPATAATAPGAPEQPSMFDRAPAWTGWLALLTGVAALALTVGAYLLSRRNGFAQRPAGSVISRLPAVAAGLWLAALVLLGWQVHWWVAVAMLVVALLALVPALVRAGIRRHRLRAIEARRPGAADAAWSELLDECADRGVPVPQSETVRVTARKVAQRHHLDEAGTDDLNTVVGVMERSWYSPGGSDGGADPRLADAFDGLRRSMQRTAPLSWRGRLLPRSLFHRRRR